MSSRVDRSLKGRSLVAIIGGGIEKMDIQEL
jgi:hypothetical protein